MTAIVEKNTWAETLTELAKAFNWSAAGGSSCEKGLAAIKDRHYERTVNIHPQLEASLTLLEAVVQEQPKREARVWQEVAERFVEASDASLERPFAGAGGFAARPKEER